MPGRQYLMRPRFSATLRMNTDNTPIPNRPMRVSRLLVVASLTCAAALPASAQKPLPKPADILGFEPGAERHLPSWKQITDYFTALDKASPRVSTRIIGKTVLGRPFIVAFISDSSTIANLEHYRQIQR